MKINISPGIVSKNAALIAAKLQRAGYPAYFVGGAVRDLLLGKTPEDIDIVTAATPDETAALFPNTQEVGAAFGVMLVRAGGISYEVATFREERNYLDGRRPETVKYCTDPKLDVNRRDFTVNGLLYDPESGEVLDYVGGIEDLQRVVLRTIGNAE
ncbi:MAG: CCA tRNA nucleotidyltransferase, partial [Victivallales bacterium]|nr:CCA tRNA nucleotidyltransferase [Victivallales bacterium]